MSNSFSPLNSLNVLTPLQAESANTAGDHITTNTDNNHTGQSRPRRKCNKIGKLKIITINCRSLKSNRKQNELLELLEQHKPDIVCGTESHLKDSINSSEVFPPNYEVHRKDRDPNGRGVFIAVKNNLIALEHKLDSHTGCEIMWIKLQSKVPDSC